MKTYRKSYGTYYNAAAPDIDFIVGYETLEHSDELFMKTNSGYALGFLVHDSDCQSPFEWSDTKIITNKRHISSDDKRAMQQALGLDSEWEPDLERIYDADCGTRQLVDDAYIEYFVDSTAIEQLLAIGWERDEEEEKRLSADGTSTPDFWFKVKCAEQDLSDGCQVFPDMFESIQHTWWKKGREDGTIGNKYAVSLDVYEHSGISYSVSGEGTQCRFDTSRGGALWIPDDDTITNIRIVAAEKQIDEVLVAFEFARAEANEYTMWCNGDCYGVVLTTYDALGTEVETDAVYGYIGMESAEAGLRDMFEALVLSTNTTTQE